MPLIKVSSPDKKITKLMTSLEISDKVELIVGVELGEVVGKELGSIVGPSAGIVLGDTVGLVVGEELGEVGASRYRAIAGRANYLSQDRAGIQFASR